MPRLLFGFLRMLLQKNEHITFQNAHMFQNFSPIRNRYLSRIGRSTGAHIGDKINEGNVTLMSNGADNRNTRSKDRPTPRLAIKRLQIFQAAATARENDHINRLIPVKPIKDFRNLQRRTLTLNLHMIKINRQL